MSGHVIDRFVYAAWPDWPNHSDAIPPGVFRASPEIARLLQWHCSQYEHMGDGRSLFGRSVLEAPDLAEGQVIFVPDAAGGS